jgi:Phage integrase, N-terminal SAM-like domain
VTGRKISVERTVRGNKREASKVLAAMVAEVDRRPLTSVGKGTVAELCREWLDLATPSFSPKTVVTTRMYIEDPIVPLLGSLHVAKLTPSDLDPFYRQLLEVGRSRGPYAPATSAGCTESSGEPCLKECVGDGSHTIRPSMLLLSGCP